MAEMAETDEAMAQTKGNVADDDPPALPWYNAHKALLLISAGVVVAVCIGVGVGVAVSNKSSDENMTNTQIIQGDEAKLGRFPYAVSIQDGGGHFCTASLIARDVVLSAGHCQGGIDLVTVGRHNVDIGKAGEEHTVAKEVVHPDYNDTNLANDLMLLFLEDDGGVFQEEGRANNEFVRINSLRIRPEREEKCVVMGWGDTNPGFKNEFSDVLMEAEVYAISNAECESSESWRDSYEDCITEGHLCAWDPQNSRDSCQGDSGGPLIIEGDTPDEDLQVGVVSWGRDCADEDFPGVYTRVSHVYDWIVGQVCKESKFAPDYFECE